MTGTHWALDLRIYGRICGLSKFGGAIEPATLLFWTQAPDRDIISEAEGRWQDSFGERLPPGVRRRDYVPGF